MSEFIDSKDAWVVYTGEEFIRVWWDGHRWVVESFLYSGLTVSTPSEDVA